MGLQAAFARGRFHRVNYPPTPPAMDEWSRPGIRLRLRFDRMTRRTGRPTAIFMLASLGSQVWVGAAAVQYNMPR